MDIILSLAVVLVPLLVVLTVLATLGWLGLAGLARVGWLGTRLLHRMRWAVRHVSSPLLACSVPQGVLPGHPRFGWPFLWPLSCVPQRLGEALVGFQGRGCADGVPPDLCHVLLLEALIFQ